MTHVFHRNTHADLPVAVSGDGAYIVDQTGKSYLDASGGAAVSCAGSQVPAGQDEGTGRSQRETNLDGADPRCDLTTRE